jgi:hypothetical protein
MLGKRQNASPAIRAQAQGLFVLMSYGIGRLIGTFAGGQIFERVASTGPLAAGCACLCGRPLTTDRITTTLAAPSQWRCALAE